MVSTTADSAGWSSKEEPESPNQRPVAVDGRVPVETAEEDGMVLAGSCHVVGTVDRPDVVRILRSDAVERVPGQP